MGKTSAVNQGTRSGLLLPPVCCTFSKNYWAGGHEHGCVSTAVSYHMAPRCRQLTDEQLVSLCAEIRLFLIANLSNTGGHLASNLGIVEIATAIDRVYQSPKDKIIYDVGHQCYVHKMLTGRQDRFPTLRQFQGLSGFPRPDESVHDAYIGGHASMSISAALGMARAGPSGVRTPAWSASLATAR